MLKPEFNEVVNLPAGTRGARLETLLDLASVSSDGHKRFLEAANHILENLKMLNEKPVGLHLLGRPGTGKTFAAVALARAVYENTDDVFVSFKSKAQSGVDGVDYPFAMGMNKSHEHPFDEGPGLGVGVLDDIQVNSGVKGFFKAVDHVNHEGGLLIVTSNETDPMFYRDRPESHKTVQEYMIEDFLNSHNIDRSTPIRDRAEAIENARIYSRIAGTMLPIIFDTEVDLRAVGGFWKDF